MSRAVRIRRSPKSLFLETMTEANKGNAKAQFSLGLMYATGEGVPKDKAEAVKWYRKSADQGDVATQFNPDLMYANRQGVPKDEAEAVKWYRRAADQGDADAQSTIGRRYANSVGLPKDDVEAYKWLLLSAAQGNEGARKRSGNLEAALTPAQREEGQRLAREFKPKPQQEGSESSR